MATDAISRTDRNMPGRLSGSRGAVVAGRAIRCGGECAVVDFCTRPPRRAMAAFAVGHPSVDRRIRLAHGGWETAVVASRALRTDRHAGVKTRRCPSRKAGSVAGIAVGDRRPRQRLVGDMRHRPAIGWRERAAMAGRALVGYGGLRMVKARRPPCGGGVAADAVGSAYGNVDGRLASGGAAVVACSAVRRSREAAVVNLSAGPSCGLVAALAVSHTGVNRRGRLRAGVARGALVAD